MYKSKNIADSYLYIRYSFVAPYGINEYSVCSKQLHLLYFDNKKKIESINFFQFYCFTFQAIVFKVVGNFDFTKIYALFLT